MLIVRVYLQLDVSVNKKLQKWRFHVQIFYDPFFAVKDIVSAKHVYGFSKYNSRFPDS